MGNPFVVNAYAKAMKRTRIVASDNQLLYEWSGTHWSVRDVRDEERAAYEWLSQRDPLHASADKAKKAYCTSLLEAELLQEMTDEVIVPCQNGYLHFVDNQFQLRSPDLTLGIKHTLSCNYDPAVGHGTKFQQFLEQILPDEQVRGRVQEYIGYTLLPDCRYQRFQIWLGSGANGKGVLANVIQALHSRVAAVRLDQVGGFGAAALVGASLAYVDELPKGRINEDLLKSMIAGERISIDVKYRDSLSLCLTAKWIVLGNHLPVLTDHSTGFWRRCDIVPFETTVAEVNRDPLLAKTIIDTELSAVLNWAIEGLVRLQTRGMFNPLLPPRMDTALYSAKEETNSVLAWANDVGLEVQFEAKQSKDDIYQDYRLWCERNGLSALSTPKFWPRIKDIKSFSESRMTLLGKYVRVCNLGYTKVES